MRALSPTTIRKSEQYSLPIATSDALDAELIANREMFAVYAKSRESSTPPASRETLKKERLQWKAFCDFLTVERLSVHMVTEATFHAFFARPERKLNHIRNFASYLRLFDYVLRANALAGKESGDEALAPVQWNQSARRLLESEGYRSADRRGNKQPPVFLTPEDDRLLTNHLYTVPEQATVKELRTFVYMAVLRGSGATPGEIRTLQVDEVGRGDRGQATHLRMFGRGGAGGRVYPLADFAVRALTSWMLWNEAENASGHRGFPLVVHPVEKHQVRYVFPNLFNTSPTLYGQAIDSDTCTRNVREALHAIGLKVTGSVTQLLRTQFGTDLLRSGASVQEVTKRMGMYDSNSLISYQRIVDGNFGQMSLVGGRTPTEMQKSARRGSVSRSR